MHAVVGAGAVLMAVLAYKAFKTTGTKASISPTNPGGGFTPTAPGQYLSTDQLIYDTVTGKPYTTVPSTDDLITSTIYGSNVPSVIKVGYW